VAEPAEGRAAVAGDIARGIEPGAPVPFLLHQAEADQRLVPGREDAALGQVVFVIEGDVCERHGGPPRPVCPRGAVAARARPGLWRDRAEAGGGLCWRARETPGRGRPPWAGWEFPPRAKLRP